MATEPKVVGRQTIDGDECFVVEVRYVHAGSDNEEGKTVWLWINPNKGYTVPLMRMWSKGGVLAEKTLVQERKAEVRQYPGGLWGPAAVTFDEYALNATSGKTYIHWHSSTTYDGAFRFDISPTQENLSLDLPSGTQVHDELLDADYTVP